MNEPTDAAAIDPVEAHPLPIERAPLLLFSGGLDSTYLLYDLLQRSPVDVLYCDGGQHPLKILAERIARKKIIEAIEALGAPFKVRNQYTADRFSLSQNPSVLFQQPPAWIFGALSQIEADKHSSLEVGYVSGDCALTYRHEMTRAWEALNEMCLSEKIPLRMPLMRHTKGEVLSALPSELRALVWVCETPQLEEGGESPNVEPCGHCLPCERWEYEQLRFDRTRARDNAVTGAVESIAMKADVSAVSEMEVLEALKSSGMKVTAMKLPEGT